MTLKKGLFMDYLEIEGKAQLERYGIRTNGGVILEGDEIPPEVTFPCVLKGQIQAGHRGQHGAVKVVKTPEELLKVKTLRRSQLTENIWKALFPQDSFQSQKSIIWD